MSEAIQLPENLTIHHIDTQYNELNKQFNDAGDQISIDASMLETIDTSGLQSLLALVNTANENGKKVVWQNTPDILTTSAKKIGIDEALSF